MIETIIAKYILSSFARMPNILGLKILVNFLPKLVIVLIRMIS
jgi:hypothetical protein